MKLHLIGKWSHNAFHSFSTFLVFFVTLTLFPSVQSDIKRSNEDFLVPHDFYASIMCFLVFNITAMIGSSIASAVQWPNEKYLVIPIVVRVLFIPLYLFCEYYPAGTMRSLPVYIKSDLAYLIIGVTMGLSHGYLSSISMMYCPRMVEPQYSSIAGMFGAASLVTGIFTGILFSFVMPLIVS